MNPQIESILNRALDEVRALLLAEASEAVRAALGDGRSVGNGRRTSVPSVKAAPPKAAKPAKRPKGAKRTAEEIDALTASVEAAVKNAKTGIRSEQIAGQLGVATADLVLPLQRLLATKKYKTKGVRRGMQYLPR